MAPSPASSPGLVIAEGVGAQNRAEGDVLDLAQVAREHENRRAFSRKRRSHRPRGARRRCRACRSSLTTMSASACIPVGQAISAASPGDILSKASLSARRSSAPRVSRFHPAGELVELARTRHEHRDPSARLGDGIEVGLDEADGAGVCHARSLRCGASARLSPGPSEMEAGICRRAGEREFPAASRSSRVAGKSGTGQVSVGLRERVTAGRRTAWAMIAFASVGFAAPASGQTASLVADRIVLDGENAIVAEGDVEVFFEGAELSAQGLRYDRETDSFTLDGPIRLSDGERVVILAGAADLDADLRNGILTSARFVLDQQLQLTAARIRRVDGRYTELSRTIASSCRICEAGAPPIWEIRASRVIHDEAERQLYLDNAQFRVAGLPVFYWPSLRLPDPTLTRATGFLLPQLVTTSQRARHRLKLPYFQVRAGDQRGADVTVTPMSRRSLRSTRVALTARRSAAAALTFEGPRSPTTRWKDGTRQLSLRRGQGSRSEAVTSSIRYRARLRPLVPSRIRLFARRTRLDSAVSINQHRQRTSATHSRVQPSFRTHASVRNCRSPTMPTNPVRGGARPPALTSDVFGGPLWLSFDVMGPDPPVRTSRCSARERCCAHGADFRWTWLAHRRPGIVAETEGGGGRSMSTAVKPGPEFSVSARARLRHRTALTLRWPLVRGAGRRCRPRPSDRWCSSPGRKTSGAAVARQRTGSRPNSTKGKPLRLSRYPGIGTEEEGLRRGGRCQRTTNLRRREARSGPFPSETTESSARAIYLPSRR